MYLSFFSLSFNFSSVVGWDNKVHNFSCSLFFLRISFYLLRTFCPHLGRVFLCCFFFHYVSAKFHLWPSSGDLLRPWIGMLSLVTVSPVITAFRSCCLSHHWRRPEVKFGRNVVKEETTQKKKKKKKKKTTKMRKKVRNKWNINSQIKKSHLKMIPIKDNSIFFFFILIRSGRLTEIRESFWWENPIGVYKSHSS